MSSLASHAAGLLCVGFQGAEVSPELRELVARGVRSVVLFSRNVGDTPEAVFALTRAIKALSEEPILVAVDQEGGLVQRLRRGFTELPPLAALGETASAELAFATGALLGRELAAVGIDWNFAPVVDVDTNPQNPVIGRRSLGRDPALVARLGVALARGLTSQGVAACAKHFPGHGDTVLDSHLALPRLEHSLERLEAVELVPFVAAIADGIPAIMTAHVVFSALDAALPATLSRAVLSGLLRQRLGYDGLVVSDDLEMKAVVDHFGIEEAMLRGIQAGVDVFLICHKPARMHAAIDSVVRSVERGDLPFGSVLRASERRRAFAARWAAAARDKPDLSALRRRDHLELAERLGKLAITSAGHDPTERA
jgi:beta-N-acetylhexosaminidase